MSRLKFYIGALVLAVAVWSTETYMQSRTQVWGPELRSLTQLQEDQLQAFSNMNRLLITLGTTMLGAMGFLLVSRRKGALPPKELWAGLGSVLCVALSLYFAYHAYEDLVLMLQYKTFDLTSPQILWDRNAHFVTFLLGVFLFGDFAFQELGREVERERSLAVAAH